MKYRFKFAIGDWSKDGHGQCEYFIVKSNKSVEEVREYHYQIKNITGIDIDNMCRKDNIISNENYQLFINLGFDFEAEGMYLDIDNNNNLVMYCDPLLYVKLWMFLLQQVDKTLQIERIIEDVPMFQFYGVDEKRRHIEASGYGLF